MVAPRDDFFANAVAVGWQRVEAALKRRTLHGGRDECWPFTGQIPTRGYGRVRIGAHRFPIHRLAWVASNRRDPGDLLVCHRCDNRACCNPAHLYLGTPLDNHRDMVERGRRAKQPVRRHKVGRRITEETAARIKGDPRPSAIVADQYGLPVPLVTSIRGGQIWKRVEPLPPPTFRDVEITKFHGGEYGRE